MPFHTKPRQRIGAPQSIHQAIRQAIHRSHQWFGGRGRRTHPQVTAAAALAACIAAAVSWTPPAVHAQAVYRCGNTYTQQACKGGRVVDTAPPVASADSAAAREDGPVTVYLCEGKNGGKFWSRQHCHAHGAWIDRTETVPGGMRWQDQVATASAQRAEMAALAAPRPRWQPEMPSAPALPDPRAACIGLERRIAELDAMGRVGSRYYDLDRIRTERREARDQQFRLRC